MFNSQYHLCAMLTLYKPKVNQGFFFLKRGLFKMGWLKKRFFIDFGCLLSLVTNKP